MNRGRAQRRAHFERIKRKVSKHSWFRNHEQGGYEIPEPRELGIWSKTPKRCSCVICGHIRDHEGPTRQELVNKENNEEL